MPSLLPKGYTDTEHNLDSVSEEVRSRINGMIWNAPLLDPMRCDVRFLDSIASFYSVYFFGNTLTEQAKREFIRDNILLKQRRGTLWAVKQVVNALDPTIEIEEGTLGFPLDGTIGLDGFGILGGNDGAFLLHLKSHLPVKNIQGIKMVDMVKDVAPARVKTILHHAGLPLDGSAKADGSYTLGEINAFN